MLTQTRLVWLALIIAISCGLAIEILKTTHASQDGSSWRPRIFGMAAEDEEITLEYRSVKAGRARSRLLKGRVAGLSENTAFIAPPVAAAVIAGPPVPNLTPLSSKMSEEDKKKALDAAKKKKKKKKKSATEEVAAVEAAPAPQQDSGKSKSSSDVSGGSSMNKSSNNRRSIILGAAEINEIPETLEQWLAYILPEPNYDRTLNLIKGHEIRTVDSEIFHEVIAQMLADSRAKMHEYAIYALGTAPSLKSFILLEAANMNEPTGSPLKLMSRTNLLAYSKLENLRYLAGAISSGGETNSAYEAMRLIQLAASEHKPKPSAPSGGPATMALAISRQFSSLVPILMRVSQLATDASLRREATTTLRLVQVIVGTPTPVASLQGSEIR